MLLFQTSREIIFYFQHFIQVCFYFLGKKTGGARAPPAPPLATALECKDEKKGGRSKHYAGIIDALNKSHNHIWRCPL